MSSDAQSEARRKRVLWRANHRGIKEMDILMGGYATREVWRMTDAEIAVLEQLMNVPDQELLAYATGQTAIPAHLDNAILRAILAFRP
jgi:antitoxin CptB